MNKKYLIIGGVIVAVLLCLAYAALAAPTTFVSVYPVNLTNYTSFPTFNATVVDNATTGCYFTYYNGTLSNVSNFTMANDTITNWYNVTSTGIKDSVQWGYGNITYRCHNSTDLAVSGTYFFHLDVTAPTVTADNVTKLNYTSNGLTKPYLNVTFIGTDADTFYSTGGKSRGWIKVYGPGGGNGEYECTNNTPMNNSNTAITFHYNVTDTQLSGTGWFRIDKWATDWYGKNSTTSANYVNNTGVAYALKTGWNMIGTYGNETYATVCDRISNITYVSLFNNSGNYHNYTTYACGASTGASTVIGDGRGIYVYATTDVQAYNVNYSSFSAPATYISTNMSTTDTPWNMAGIYAVGGRRLSAICSLDGNITYVSYNDFSNNTYYTHKCGWDINNVTAPVGTAVWIKYNNTPTVATDQNTTISP